jgi:hypothetical protein
VSSHSILRDEAYRNSLYPQFAHPTIITLVVRPMSYARHTQHTTLATLNTRPARSTRFQPSGEIFAEVMRDYLLFLGVPPKNINIQTHLPKVDWEQYHRIDLLAKMRNEGMKPLYDTAPSGLTYDGKPWSAVIYYNDVYLSGTHFLELLHQHYMQDADMTCGWDHAGRWFYDGWVGRDMSGDLYTPFPVKEEDKDLPQKVSHSSSSSWPSPFYPSLLSSDTSISTTLYRE